MVKHARKLTTFQVQHLQRSDEQKTGKYMSPEVMAKSQPPSELSDIMHLVKCIKCICLKIDKQEHTCPPAVGHDIPCKFCHKHERLSLLGDRCSADRPRERFQSMEGVSINLDLIFNE